jgi:hypothetical protein
MIFYLFTCFWFKNFLQKYGVKFSCTGQNFAMFGHFYAGLYPMRYLVQFMEKWLNFISYPKINNMGEGIFSGQCRLS